MLCAVASFLHSRLRRVQPRTVDEGLVGRDSVLDIARIGNMYVIMVRAWVLYDSLPTRTDWEHVRNHGSGMDALPTRTDWEHVRNHGSGMDALPTRTD